jgi:heme/copper-type cytochrome/quinol oxidase subunit 4
MQKSVQARKNRIISAMSGQFQSELPIFKTNRNTNRNLEGNNMNRFGVKLILSIVSFLAVNIWLIGKGVAKGAADFFISATVEETILFIILQLLVVLIYFIYPLTVKKYKIIYWSVSEALVIITVLFWGIFIVGPIWLK